MEGTEEEQKQNQGVIKTVASPTVLAAILDESVDGKQSFGGEECLQNSSQGTLSSLEMDKHQKESNLDDSIVADSLEYVENAQSSFDEQCRQEAVQSTSNVSEVNSSLDKNSLLESSQKASRGPKPLEKNIKGMQSKKQKAKETNFIDLNKGKLNRTSGKTSYAAIYSQKLNSKKENPKLKEDVKDSARKEESHPRINNIILAQQSQQNKPQRYSSLQESTSYQFGFNPLHERSDYYNVDPLYLQSNSNNNYGVVSNANPPTTGFYNDYFTQPYHAPYRDFGLRYSNYGHQLYMAAGAATAPRPANNDNQAQGYSSQSAPPAGLGRPSLLDQVELFPEQEHVLSQSLTNSQFVNPKQLYYAPSALDRRFVSEPHLSSLHSFSESGRKDDISENTADRKAVLDYKPYTLKDYKQFTNDQPDRYGGLGPETETDEYKEKISKLNKQREYAEMLRIDHAAKKKQWSKKPAVAQPPARQQLAEAKRQAAINYAKSIPKPKVTDQTQQKEPSSHTKPIGKEGDVPLIELLRMRHLQEKRQVEAMKKELLSKTQ